jgi:hypothetical protein
MVAPAGVHPVVGESGVSETNLEQEHALIGGNMATQPRRGRWTYEEFARLPEDGNRYEIIAGELYVTPSP